MWIVCKYKSKELSTLKKNLCDKINDEIKFYYPKIKYQKTSKKKIIYCEKNIMEEYMFCYHPLFSKKKVLDLLDYTRGLKYFLKNSQNNQNEIIEFLNYCKKFENNGYLTQSFFLKENLNKAKFLEGPFTNMIFEILSREKNKIKILLGKIETTINTNKYLFCSI